MSMFVHMQKGSIQVKNMPPKILLLISYVKNAVMPAVGFGSLFTFVQLSDISYKPIWGLAGAIAIAYFTYLATKVTQKTKVDIVQVETQATSDVTKSELTLKIFDRAVQESERARAHFTEELKNQRTHFSGELKEARDHYELKQKELRQEYHDRLGAAGQVADRANTNLIKLKLSLSNFGIRVGEDNEIILPADFDRRKTRDTNRT